MEFGITPWSITDTNDATALCDQALFAEKLGFKYFFLPEHHFVKGRAIPEPLLLLAAVAAKTESIRLATTSYLLPLRHPLQAAEQVAVLDRLSNGRLTLGVGRGASEVLFSTFEVPSKKKRSLFEDCYHRMISAWNGDSVAPPTSDSTTTISPLPLQEPHPPIWVAAFGPMALAQAGRLGLPYLASPRESLSRLKRNYAIHREACLEANVTVPSETPIMRSVFVSKDERRIRDVRERMAQDMALNPATDTTESNSTVDDWALVGSPSYVRDLLDSYRANLNMTHLVATRLGIRGISSREVQESLSHLAELA
ncbi:MAG: LLM class flavin-dependent oxidoreductase [Gammaproteobacteria bacterium]|nr:LLM class flavin-dependent oxidoreductase [Gammaproteobacteria bacterium]